MGIIKLLKLGRQLRVKPENGQIFLNDTEVMILPTEITEELFISLNRVVGAGGASSSLYIAGKELSEPFFDILKKMYGADILNSEKKIKMALEYFVPFIGFGRVEIIEVDLKKAHIIFKGQDFPEVGITRSTDTQACHIVRGIFTGFMEILTKTPCTGEETKCQAKGDEYCEFVINPS